MSVSQTGGTGGTKMGLFDKVFGKSEISAPEKFSKQEAFLAVAVATSGADGHIAQSEIHEIANYLNRMKMFEGYSYIFYINIYKNV